MINFREIRYSRNRMSMSVKSCDDSPSSLCFVRSFPFTKFRFSSGFEGPCEYFILSSLSNYKMTTGITLKDYAKTTLTQKQQRNENEPHRSSTCLQRRGPPHKLHHGKSLTVRQFFKSVGIISQNFDATKEKVEDP